MVVNANAERSPWFSGVDQCFGICRSGVPSRTSCQRLYKHPVLVSMQSSGLTWPSFPTACCWDVSVSGTKAETACHLLLSVTSCGEGVASVCRQEAVQPAFLIPCCLQVHLPKRILYNMCHLSVLLAQKIYLLWVYCINPSLMMSFTILSLYCKRYTCVLTVVWFRF